MIIYLESTLILMQSKGMTLPETSTDPVVKRFDNINYLLINE